MDVQAVLNAVAKTAARLCDANDALIFQVEGDQLRLVAKYGALPTTRVLGEAFPLSRGTVDGRAVLDQRPIHVRDLAAAARIDFQEMKAAQRATGVRTILATPLLLKGSPVGVIRIRRRKVRPFSAKQIALSRRSPIRPRLPSRMLVSCVTSLKRWTSRPRRARSCA